MQSPRSSSSCRISFGSALLLAALFLAGVLGCEPAPAAPEPATPTAETPAPRAPSIPKPGRTASEEVVRFAVDACVAKGTSAAARSRSLALLSSIASPAGEPCYLQALREYQPGDPESEADLRAASKAVAALKLVSARGPLFEAFARLRASNAETYGGYGEVYDAMIAVADPAWEPRLLRYLDRPVVRPDRPVDPRNRAAEADETFWQLTAAELLGTLRSAAAARPLLRFMLTSTKRRWRGTATLALLHIGKPAVEAATKLLRKQDADLAAYGAAEAKAASDPVGAATPVEAAAAALGAIGRAESIGPMLDALAAADPTERSTIACALSRLPADPRTLAAFRRTLEAMPPDVKSPEARDARVRLAHCAADFFDPSVVPWLADDARRLQGSEDLVQAVREAELVTMLQVARPDQKKHLDELATLGNPVYPLSAEFKTAYTVVTGLFVACGDRVDCWLDRLTDPAAKSSPCGDFSHCLIDQRPDPATKLGEKPFQAIKAAHMVAALGGADAKPKLLAALPRLENPMVVSEVGDAIDRLSPQADPAATAALQTMIDAAAGDQKRRRARWPLTYTVWRLQARVP